uniref:Thioredoxin domain-containing protein n=1 Tax=Spumella elongata TaxID=89044 RepID=A0A7S3M0F6_9STRA|mmetsp:Transcript_15715/g.27643  ORF Transcript_15715/g.27643 Transcript_15715/m.27643 type:complete len:135 (+) Transcript_15715:2-406(+)
MKSTHADKQKKLAQGHGEYEMIDEKDFFNVCKKSEYIVVHFWRESTWRCEVMDKHIKQLCLKHWGTRFVKINAEKSPYLTERLHIWCLPSLVLCKAGKTEHTVVGFSEFKSGDEASTEEVEELLAKYGVISLRD